MEITNGSSVYIVTKNVADAKKYRLYLCVQKETNRQCLLQAAVSKEYNVALIRAAYILAELKRRSDEIEEEYEKKNPGKILNYHLGFPELVDGFIPPGINGRRVNVLAFRNVDETSRMVPLINITEKDRLRVDLRTSAWIMGKQLKLFTLTHNENFSMNLVSGKNILIEPNEHYVLFFDWTAAEIHPDEIPMEKRRQEISFAAQAVIAVLGGDWKKGFIPNDKTEPFQKYVDARLERIKTKRGGEIEENEPTSKIRDRAFKRYVDFLLRLARGNESRAEKAHRDFYDIVDALWEREFYQFTTKPL